MTRPGDGEISSASEAQATLRPGVARLKKRADFLAAAKGRREHQRCFVLQARPRAEAADPATQDHLMSQDHSMCMDAPRFGFTVTKKVGNSVIRNRIRRRLREAVRLTDFSLPRPGHDYVLIARIEALTAPFEDMRGEIFRALTKIHQSRIRQTKIQQTEIQQSEIQQTEIQQSKIQQTEIQQTEIHLAGPDRRPPAVPAVDRKQDH